MELSISVDSIGGDQSNEANGGRGQEVSTLIPPTYYMEKQIGEREKQDKMTEREKAKIKVRPGMYPVDEEKKETASARWDLLMHDEV